MQIQGQAFRSIWRSDADDVSIIDQTLLPHRFALLRLVSLEDAARAIADMRVRGAPLIGATAAWGVALAMRADASDAGLKAAVTRLGATRPTAVNLQWALARVEAHLQPVAPDVRIGAADALAEAISDEDVAINSAIGDHGLAILRMALARKQVRHGFGARLNILTHCNAGWLATVDWGTATAPIYKAHDAGLPVHVYVDETRPRNQGASLTAWELGNHGVPHTLIVDNAGGHLMQRGDVDIVIVGTDRTTARGDVCNKIGTYLKALAAHDNGVPFYVAAPSPSIDFAIDDGLADIPIENRGAHEVTHLTGETEAGDLATIRIAPAATPALNPGFDVTPAKYVTGLITERGLIAANAQALRAAFPDRIAAQA